MTFTQPYGVTIGSGSASGSLNSQAITDMNNLGVTWLRYQIKWSLIDATGTTNQNTGTYTWGAWDSAVSQCNAAGINITLTIMQAPAQFQGPSGNPLNPSYTATFASQIASRYNGGSHGTIQGIEVGNEDYNSGGDTTSIPVPLVQSLAATMKSVYPAIKAVNSSLLVGVACKLQRNSAGYTAFFDTLLKSTTGPYISSVFQGDYLNFHYYTAIPTSGGTPVSLDPTVDIPTWNGGQGLPSITHAWQLIQAKMSQYSVSLPIWLTEYGPYINTNPGRNSAGVVSQATEWQYYKDILDSCRTSGIVAKNFFFTLGYYAGYAAPNYRDGCSLVQGTLGSPTYTTAYNNLKSYIAANPTWGSGGTGGALTSTPAALSFSAIAGGASPATQSVTVTNSDSSSASYSASDDASWLSVSPTSGTIASGGHATATVSVNSTGLVVGTYSGTVTWQAGALSDSTTVTLVVSAATPPPAVTPLTAYFPSAVSPLIPTANQIYTTAGTPANVNVATTLGTATGWGEIVTQSSTAPWPAASAIGGPSGYGFVWGAKSLENNDLQGGPYTAAVRLNMIGVGAVSITADIHVRLWKWHATNGFTTLIADCVASGQTIATTKTTFAPTGTASVPTSFSTGEKLYIEIKVNVTANTGPSAAQIQLNDLSTDTAGFIGSPTACVVTPGYAPTAALPAPPPPSGAPPLGPPGAWAMVWHDEFDDSLGMSGPTRGLALSKWNGGWWSGPSSPGVGTNTVTAPVNTSLEIEYHGPAGILFPGDGAVHLRLQAGVDNGGSFGGKTVEGGFLATAGLMEINPGSTPVQTSGPDLRPYTINGPVVLEVRMRVPGPNANSAHFWPGMALFNAGNYGGTNPSGAAWPGGQNYLQEIDLIEMFSGGSLGSSSALNFHAASSYSSAGIPDSLLSVDLSLDYHIYTYYLTTTTFLAWVDGIPAIAIAPTTAEIAAQFAVPMYLNFQFGAQAGATYPTTAAGTPSDFMIDYVRVWQPAQAIGLPLSLTINQVPYPILGTSLVAKSMVGRQGELSVTVYDVTGANHIQQWQQVALYGPSGALAYSGYVSEPEEMKPGFAPILVTTFTAMDQRFLAKKRILAKLYRNQTTDFMANDIFTNILAAEGVTIGQIAISGVTVPIANFGYVSVDAALDAIVVAASSSGNPYYWTIDQNLALWVVPYAAVTGPAIDGTQIDDGRLSGVIPKVKRANPLYRNTQYAVGGVQETASNDETRAGDGQTRVFPYRYPLNGAPSIFTLNGTSKSLGVKGQTGFNYYYAVGDNTIAQDDSQTILVSTDRLRMVYVGQESAVFQVQNTGAVATQAALDGSSGIVEAVLNDSTIASHAQGTALVGQQITQYCRRGNRFTFATQSSGITPGQLCTISYAPYGFANTQMLIEEVDLSDGQDGVMLWYTVTAVQGPYDTTWSEFFGNLFKPPGFQLASNISLGIALNTPLFPSTTLFPSPTLYPQG